MFGIHAIEQALDESENAAAKTSLFGWSRSITTVTARFIAQLLSTDFGRATYVSDALVLIRNFRNTPFGLTQISFIFSASCPPEGRLAIFTDAGRDAVDVMVPLTNGAKADGEVVWF